MAQRSEGPESQVPKLSVDAFIDGVSRRATVGVRLHDLGFDAVNSLYPKQHFLVDSGADRADRREVVGDSGSAPRPMRLRVPIDRSVANSSSILLTIDLGAAFDPRKPTVLVVEDGQQFYVRPGAMAELQRALFGPGVNVAGLVPRGSESTAVAATVTFGGSVNWRKAWRVFNSREWIEDLDAARQALVGPAGMIDLYGRSGGAYLVHEYLAVHGKFVRRAFTQAAVDPALNRELNIPLDDYVEQLRRSPGSVGSAWQTLVTALPDSGEGRLRDLLLLQRQHFYVPADSFIDAQRSLIAAIAARDSARLTEFGRRYEVDEIMKLERSRNAIPQDVRVLELIGPSGAFDSLSRGRGLFPLIESQALFIKPLLDLEKRREVTVKPRSRQAAHRLSTQVFVLAASDDEAVDYRTSIALANEYQNHTLFIARDNHVFAAMDKAGARQRLVQSFFVDGPSSKHFADAVSAAAPFRWSPGAERAPEESKN